MPARRKSAYSAVMKEVQQRDGETGEQQKGITVQQEEGTTGEPSDSETVLPYYREEGEQQDRQTAKQPEHEKITFYLTPDQAMKLDDLAHDYKKRTGKRINRNDIVRYLIDQADPHELLTKAQLERPSRKAKT